MNTTGRYHFNPATGSTSRCQADLTNPKSTGCKFKLSVDQHYTTAEEAEEGFSEFLQYAEGVTAVMDGLKPRERLTLTVEQGAEWGLSEEQTAAYNTVISSFFSQGKQFSLNGVAREIGWRFDSVEQVDNAVDNLREQLRFPAQVRAVFENQNSTRKERLSALAVAHSFEKSLKLSEMFSGVEIGSGQGTIPIEDADDVVPFHGVHCRECNEPIGATTAAAGLDWAAIECSVCGESSYMDSWGVRVTENHSTYPALDADNIPEMTWYHSTVNENWGSALVENGGFYTHVGSEQAAMDRQLSANKVIRHKGFWVYELGVKKGVSISPEVAEDENDDYNADYNPTTDPRAHQVERYINNIEDPGSISLVVDSTQLEIRSRKFVPTSEAVRYPSLFNVVGWLNSSN